MVGMETEIEVRFYGGFARAAGAESAIVRFGGDTLGELLAEIRKRWPDVAELLDGPGKGTAVLVLNGMALEQAKPDTPIKRGDVVSIMPFVAGG
jgi:molybdopterin converting factor small subunit